MNDRFYGSRLKVERAEKHILDLYSVFHDFSNTDFYSMRVEEDSGKRTHSLHFDMNLSGLNFGECALIIGDALHNLRSALDHLYYRVVLDCGGKPSPYTRFPIFDSVVQLQGFIKSALKNAQITRDIERFLIDEIRPYQAGNPTLWGLHSLNITDKHEMIVPVLKLVAFFDVRIENEDGEKVGLSNYIAEESCVIPLTGTYRKRITLKDKGRASANVFFNVGASAFAGKTVHSTLKLISEEVTRTVNTFATFMP